MSRHREVHNEKMHTKCDDFQASERDNLMKNSLMTQHHMNPFME